ncbi:Probable acyl-CoA ligase FadD [Mycobacteroides abscessus]|nr:Probable acyl-CoA ligase FadD [Mycobacteroides abscessus]
MITAAPNFAYEYTAQRGVPKDGAGIDLGKAVMIIGSEPVSIDAIRNFEKAFAPFGLPSTAFKPSYGIAEATLFIANIAPDAEPSVAYLDRTQLARGRAVPTDPDTPHVSVHVSCGQLARSLHGVIVDPVGTDELPDGHVGEIWLQGNNIGRGYWGRPEDTEKVFHARLGARQPKGHAGEADIEGDWLRTGDMGFYLDGELYVTGRLADHIEVDGSSHYPQDIEASVAAASPIVRRGYVTAFTVPGGGLVIVAERASRTAKADPQEAIDAISAAVDAEYGLKPADVLSGATRPPVGVEITHRFHPPPAALDQGTLRRLRRRSGDHRGTQLRLRVHRATRGPEGRCGYRPGQGRDDHRLRAGQHRRYP